MRCNNCPLFSWWNNESDRGEACGIFEDGWSDPLQYEDKDGTTIGCYVDRHYIEKVAARQEEIMAQEVEAFLREEKEDEMSVL